MRQTKVPTLKLYKHVSSTLTKLCKSNKVSLLKKKYFCLRTKFIPRLFRVLSFKVMLWIFNNENMKHISQLNHLSYHLCSRQSYKNTTLIFIFKNINLNFQVLNLHKSNQAFFPSLSEKQNEVSNVSKQSNIFQRQFLTFMEVQRGCHLLCSWKILLNYHHFIGVRRPLLCEVLRRGTLPNHIFNCRAIPEILVSIQ